MAQPKYHVLFPIETINREMDFRILLGAMMVDSTMRVFIGNSRRINHLIPSVRGGIYLGKDLIYRHRDPFRYYAPFKKNGFANLYLHEEGGIFFGDESDWHAHLDWDYEHRVRYLSPDDILCNWGTFQNEHYRRKIPEMAANMRVTGHPRFDIYKAKYRSYYDREVKALRERHNRFVLINTNLSLSNYSKGLAGIFQHKHGYDLEDSAKRLSFVGNWAHTNNVLGGIVALTHRLSVEFPDLVFVLRPHPSENLDFYRTVFMGVKNIVVEHTGSVGPWIMASELLIHDGCTTAVEAYLSDKPIINYKPVARPEFDIKIPNEFGLQARNEGEVVDAVAGFIRTGKHIESARPSELACSMVNNFRQDGYELMLVAMRDALGRSGSASTESMGRIVAHERFQQLRDWPKEVTRPLSRKAQKHAADRQKFYGFDEDALALKFTAVQELLNKPLRCQRISSQLLTIDSG